MEKINTHGGSIRVYLSNKKNKKIDRSVNKMIKDEEEFGIKEFNTYKSFGEKVYKLRKNVIKNITKIKKSGKNIIGYGFQKSNNSIKFWYK